MSLSTSVPVHLRVLSRSQLVLRILVLLAPLCAVLSAAAAGDGPPWWYAVVVALLALALAAFPEGQVGVAVNAAVLLWWAIGPDDSLHPVVLVAAAALVVTHVAALLTTYGPSAMPVDPALLRRWLWRGLAALAAAPLGWGLAVLLRDAEDEPRLWLLGVAAGVVATVVASLSLGRGAEPEEVP
jgi:hypothetical protein